MPAASSPPGASSGGATSPAAPSWVFPFDRPAAPAADGNQALAVNTTNGSVAYSVAFALVWADDGEPVTTTNEAHAFANCMGCAAVVVGFQVVLVMGQNCLAYAVASQLVLTLDGPLEGDRKQQLEALWARIAEYGRNIQDVPLSDIQATLTGYKEQITAIIKGTSVSPGSSATAPATSSATAGPGTGPSPEPTSTFVERGLSAPAAAPGETFAPAPAATEAATAPAGQYGEGGQPTSSVDYATPAPTSSAG
ncbi:hypothetical protein [Arthrobacter sp. C152]